MHLRKIEAQPRATRPLELCDTERRALRAAIADRCADAIERGDQRALSFWDWRGRRAYEPGPIRLIESEVATTAGWIVFEAEHAHPDDPERPELVRLARRWRARNRRLTDRDVFPTTDMAVLCEGGRHERSRKQHHI